MKNMELPKEIEINLWELLKVNGRTDEFWDLISDCLTDKYGSCHNGFHLNDNIELEITDIDWDEEE